MAQVLNLSEAEVNGQLDQLRKDRVLLGWHPVLNLALEDANLVRAVIEVKITPQREGGFDIIAQRLSRFAEVRSAYLMSGTYDLPFGKGRSFLNQSKLADEVLGGWTLGTILVMQSGPPTL